MAHYDKEIHIDINDFLNVQGVVSDGRKFINKKIDTVILNKEDIKQDLNTNSVTAKNLEKKLELNIETAQEG